MISVIVPIYNVEDYLRKCFDSILNQTFTDFEIIAVNDGSKDNSQKIIDEYSKKDMRIKGFVKENGGLSDARNYGMKYASGDYYFFLDSDDSITPDCLEKLMKAAKEDEADLVMCGYFEMNYDGTIIREVTREESFHKLKMIEIVDLLNSYPHCAWNKLYKASLFKEHNIEYPKGLYYEDVGSTPLLYAEASSISYINKPLVNYLVNRPGNITGVFSNKVIDIIENLKITNDYYKTNDFFELYYAELMYFNVDMIFDNLWKLKTFADKEFAKEFITKAYNHLDHYFKDWKNCSYFDNFDISKKLMLKNKTIYSLYLLGGKHA